MKTLEASEAWAIENMYECKLSGMNTQGAYHPVIDLGWIPKGQPRSKTKKEIEINLIQLLVFTKPPSNIQHKR